MNVDHSVSKALNLYEPNNLDDFLDNDVDDVLDDVSKSRRNRNVENVAITKHVANKGNVVSKHESESENRSDSEIIIDEEKLIHDVVVDMQEFNNSTNGNVEWIGCKESVQEVNKVFQAKEDIDYEDFDSGINSDNEGVIKKATRQLGKINKAAVGKIWKENFFVGQDFTNSHLIRKMVTRVSLEQRMKLYLKKIDKMRVRVICIGKLLVFISDGLSINDGPNNTYGPSSSGYNAANDDDLKCWPACCRIMRGKRNVIENNDRMGCTYKEFLACNPKEYNENGGVVVYTRWIEKMESFLDNNQKVKYITGSFVGKDLTRWNSQIRTLDHEVAIGMSWDDFKLLMKEEFCPSNKMQKLETELVPKLVTPENKRIERYINGLASQIRGMVAITEPTTIQKAVQIAGTLTDEALRNGSIKKNPENRENEGEPSKDRNRRDDNKRTRTGNAFATTANLVRREYTGGRAFMLGAEEARQDPNIMTGIEPSDLGFSYEIKIASGQLVEINKVIKGCKLEIDGHVFDINLIPFGSESFDMIIGMDWLSNHKAEIICHEKVVRISLPGGRLIGERPKEKARQLMSAKAKENKQEEIVVVRDFPEVFLNGLSGLPPNREIKFRIELVPRAIPVTKSPYRLVPSKMDELIGIRTAQEFWLREVQFLGHVINDDVIHVDPSKIESVNNWKAPRTLSKVHLFLGLKSKTYDWGEEQENAFQTLKDLLCNAHVLALPDGPEDFVVYNDASGLGLGCVLMQRGKVIAYASSQRELNMRQRHWSEIRYHPGKANVVADALSRKERVKPKRVRAMNMTLQSSIKDKILVAQKEACDESTRLQKGLDKMIKLKSDEALYYLDRIWVPLKGDKWEGIAMDFVTKLPRTSSGHDTIWVIVDRLTKSTHFLPMREDYKIDRLARLYLNDTVARHEMLRAYVLDFEGSWDVYLTLVEISYNNSYHYSVRCAAFEALYGRKCRSSIMWAEVGEGQLIGPDLVQDTTEKISQIKDRLKVARDRQKSYSNKRRKPLEFSVGDYVLLKVWHWKGVVGFGKKGRLAPRLVGPFEIIDKVGPVAYRLDLPQELDGVHDTFHVSNLKKCLAYLTLQVPLDEIRVDDKFNFVEEPVEIMEREFKKLRRSRIAIVKVSWNSKRGPEFTWELEDQMKLKSCPGVVAFACVILSWLVEAFARGKNPNTTVKIDVDRSGDTSGQILTAVGIDLNNEIYPLAYELVEGETKESWKWFLDYLSNDIELFNNSNFTFITDRQKRDKMYKDLLWKCATAIIVKHFDKHIETLKEHNKEAYNWFKLIPPQHWARSHVSGRAHNDILLNNMCEVLNKQLVDGRDKPIITCLGIIREYLMKKIVNVQLVIRKCNGPLTPYVERLFKVILKDVAQIKIDWKGDLYQTTNSWIKQCVLSMRDSVGQRKKRRKSTSELADSMVKGGKLTREGKSVNCTECGQVRHNQISCKGQRSTNVGSQLAKNLQVVLSLHKLQLLILNEQLVWVYQKG
uniref:Reverse transcriptase domain-containing protein n=1 Tax=Tanacetum cinerariifolium TaxID=118510 RepID=A0A6L2JUS6_TANCI|nr:hypothetical protein [Tanacetum cinerariifolium]